MRIAAYNVNGVNGRLPVLLRWLGETEPDIMCLLELKAPDERFPAAAISDTGYEAIWHRQKSWNGVAILSREIRSDISAPYRSGEKRHARSVDHYSAQIA